MKQLLIAAFSFLPLLAFTQSDTSATKTETQTEKKELPYIEWDTLVSTTGFRFIVGEDIKLGTGTMPNGDFKYITISTRSIFVKTDGTADPVPRKWSGHTMRIKKLRREGTKKRGYTYYIVLGGGNIANYECDVDNAIATGEIVVPDEYKPKQKPLVVEVKGAGVSIADELEKLKKLFDSGTITKEEYEAAKKKLLGM